MRKYQAVLILAAALAAVPGCKKQPKAEETASGSEAAAPAAGQSPAAAPAPKARAGAGQEKFPGETDIRGALGRKEYSSAIDRFFAAKGFIASPEQQDAYSSLFMDMREQITDAARTGDPKAREALAELQLRRNGR